MMKQKSFLWGAAFFLVAAPATQAQVTLDVSKITCEQFLLFRVADPRDIGIWLSGYYHGKMGSTVVDMQNLKDTAEKVKDYCRANLQQPVMKGVETILGAGK
jgi:hypothetical protein